MSPCILSESTQGKLLRAGTAREALLLQRASVVISHCVNACVRSWPFALTPASYGIIRRCAALVHSIVSTQDQISLALSVNKRKGTMFRALSMNACMQARRERWRL